MPPPEPNVDRIARSNELIERYNATPWWKQRTRAKLRNQVLRLLIDIYRPLPPRVARAKCVPGCDWLQTRQHAAGCEPS